MNRIFQRGMAGAAFALMLALNGGPAVAGAYCTENWSEMATAVQANGLMPPKDLQQLALDKVDGKLIKVSLCQTAGGYNYKLVVLQPGGQLVNLSVDAKNPFPQ